MFDPERGGGAQQLLALFVGAEDVRSEDTELEISFLQGFDKERELVRCFLRLDVPALADRCFEAGHTQGGDLRGELVEGEFLQRLGEGEARPAAAGGRFSSRYGRCDAAGNGERTASDEMAAVHDRRG